MGKSCNNCKFYRFNDRFCSAKEINIIDKMGATYCKSYDEKRKLSENNVKCNNCLNINKYSWCYEKKKCIDEIEQEKPRRCAKFKTKRNKCQIRYKNKKYRY